MRLLQLEVVVDTAGATDLDVETCLSKTRSIIPTGVALRSEDLSVLPLSALSLDGDYVAVVDPRVDVLSTAFESILAAIERRPDLDLLYGQEVVGPDRVHARIPRWSPERLRNHDYLPGLVVLSRHVFGALEPVTSRPPTHRWETMLRAGELSRKIVHLDIALTHRRERPAPHDDRSPTHVRALLRVLQSHCNRIGLRALAVSGPTPGTTRARRVNNQSLNLALILPGPHDRGVDLSLLENTLSENLTAIVVCGPTDSQPDEHAGVTVVNMPTDSSDVADRARWGLSACQADFVSFAPPDARALDELWLEHLAGLISEETGAAAPTWIDVPYALERPHVEAEVESLPLAGTVIKSTHALAALDCVGRHSFDWFAPLLSSAAVGANFVVSPDIRLSMSSESGNDANEGVTNSRSLLARLRGFPLSR